MKKLIFASLSLCILTLAFVACSGGDSSGIGNNNNTTDTPEAPIASSVAIIGEARVFETLTGTYDFSDANGDSEVGSTFRWFRDDVEIAGETGVSYDVVASDLGKTFRFEVTPVADSDSLTVGTAVTSDEIGPIGNPVAQINPSKDATLIEEASGALANGAGNYLYVGRTDQGSDSVRRALLQFDIAGNVAAGSMIIDATLQVAVTKVRGGNRTVELRAVTAEWGEGTSDAGSGGAGSGEGDGVSSTTNDATWVHEFYNTSSWSSAGGDYNGTASDSITIGAIGTYNFSSAQMITDVQSWLDTPANNFGWIAIGDESTGQTVKRLNSRESNNGTPLLLVEYALP